MRQGENTALVEQISKRLPVQVGGGIRTLERAKQVLDAGAQRVIIGCALFSETTRPEGQTTATVNTVFAQRTRQRPRPHKSRRRHRLPRRQNRHQRLEVPDRPHPRRRHPRPRSPTVGAFLYTHIDGEGLLGGFPSTVAQRLRPLTQRQLIVAGGIRSLQEIEALAAIGVHSVAGMAVYTNLLPT